MFFLFVASSGELRKAMGFRSNELPPHIYMMRKLGYPPGWLEAAKEETSGLAIFDGAGKGNILNISTLFLHHFGELPLGQKKHYPPANHHARWIAWWLAGG